MKPLAKRKSLQHPPSKYGFDLISKRPTQDEMSRWGIFSISGENMNDDEVYQTILKYVNQYFEFAVPVGYKEDFKLSDGDYFTVDVITPERVTMVYMSLMRKESYEDINHFLHDIDVPSKGFHKVLPIYAKDRDNNPRYMSAGCLAFGCTMISARADVISDFDECRHAAWSQEYCIELGVRCFALKVASVIRGKRSHLLDSVVVAYHAWKSEYSKNERLAWLDEYYKDIKALYLKYAPIEEGENMFEELKKGNKGERVVEIQKILQDNDCKPGRVDGDFGGKTEKALKNFQLNNNLTVHGRVDKSTYDALLENKVPFKGNIAEALGVVAMGGGHGDGDNGIPAQFAVTSSLKKYREGTAMRVLTTAICDACSIENLRPGKEDISFEELARRAARTGATTCIENHTNWSIGRYGKPNSGTVKIIYSVLREKYRPLYITIARKFADALGVDNIEVVSIKSDYGRYDAYGAVREPIQAGVYHGLIFEYTYHQEFGKDVQGNIAKVVAEWKKILEIENTPIQEPPVQVPDLNEKIQKLRMIIKSAQALLDEIEEGV